MAGCCNASQDAQDGWDPGNTSLASGRNVRGSDAGSVFGDEQWGQTEVSPIISYSALPGKRSRNST